MNKYTICGINGFRSVSAQEFRPDRQGSRHLFRNENEMSRIREYIRNNPARWATDKDNPFIEDEDSCA